MLLLLAGGGAVSAGDQPKRLTLEAPKAGARVGKRPKFVARIVGGDAESLRFKIVLTRGDAKTTAYTFNELEDTHGWVRNELADKTPTVEYYVRVAVADGE